MAGVVAIAIFVLIMMGIEIKEVKTIKLKARTNYIKIIMAIIISIAVVLIFRTGHSERDAEVMIIAVIVLFYGLVPEGIGATGVVKVGTLNGNFNRYQKIELEAAGLSNQYTRIHFYLRKNNSTALVVDAAVTAVADYLNNCDVDQNKVTISDVT